LHALALDHYAYGAALRDALFVDPETLIVFAEARAAVLEAGRRLRVRLLLPAELQKVRWETILDPRSGRPLALESNLLLTRHLDTDNYQPVKLHRRSQLRALIAVAAAANMTSYGLAPIDAPSEIACFRAALTGISVDALGDDNEPCTLNALGEWLRNGAGYDILCLVAHGALNDNKPWLYLSDDDKNVEVADGNHLADLLRSLDERRPCLTVLVNCESAGDGFADTLAALGPLLARAGIPAVLAMQGRVSSDTVAIFTPIFFRELLHDGLSDRALVLARLGIRNRPDWWMPVLYTRLREGRVWQQERELVDSDTELLRHLQQVVAILVKDTPPEVLVGIEQLKQKISGQNRQSSPTAVRVLPYPVLDFVGREEEMQGIVAILSQVTRDRAMVGITGIRGMGGIGKTQLAYAAAQQLAPIFPDGQILVELRGESDRAFSPEDAVKMVIQALDSQANLPDDLSSLRAVYQSLLAGKHVLIIADNAKDRKQVQPLVPPPGCALLITSRQRFTLPGMRSVNLGILSMEQAEQLIHKICPHVKKNAQELAKLCGFLPLAIRISASLLFNSDVYSIEQFIALHNEMRLDLTSDPLYPDDPEFSVKASLKLSYDAIEPAAQITLRQLGLFSGSFDMAAAKQIVQVPEAKNVEELVLILSLYSLLDIDTMKRLRLHDLVRAFAISQLPIDEREPLKRRYLQYYLGFAHEKWLSKEKGKLEQEQQNILLALDYAYSYWQQQTGDQELSQLIIKAVNTFGVFLSSKGSYQMRLDWGVKVFNIAEIQGNTRLLAETCAYTISWCLLQQGKYEEARAYSERALQAAIQISDERIAGYASHNRAGAERDTFNVTEARQWAVKTMSYANASGDERLRRHAILDEGYADLLDQTENSFQHAEDRFRELVLLEREDLAKGTGSEELLANRSIDVGLALLNQHRFEEARTFFNESYTIGQALKHQTIIGEAEFGFAKIEQGLGDAQQARQWLLKGQYSFTLSGIVRASRAEQFCFTLPRLTID
jgi:tetratricopeptide (TPR) repeat protein